MPVDKDSSLNSESSAIGRPPAVRERLWALIPEADRRRFVEHAARWLRKGVHPEDSIIGRLLHEGCSPRDVDMAMQDVPAAVEEVEEVDAFVPVVVPSGPLLWPFGMPGYELGKTPAGRIGERLQAACGMTPEGAAAIEWRIHRAVARDPSFVVEDVSNLRFLGCDIGPAHLAAVAELVEAEGRSVEADVRGRQAAGDPSSMGWIDPRDSIFGAFESSS
jgi:hypothetical protein